MKAASLKSQMPVVNPSDFHWKPKETLPPGARAATVHGDPQKGDYAFFGEFPANYTVPLHWHTNDCMVVITRGSMTIRPENAEPIDIVEGGFFMLPAKFRYVAHTQKDCIFLVWGREPFDIHYANAKDDPRNK